MDEQTPTIDEAIDACRAGSDDLSQPEMQHLAECIEQNSATLALLERVQRLDANIAKAFGDVPIPDGLANRLLASAALASDDVDSSTDNAIESEFEHKTESEVAVLPRDAARRYWRWLGIGSGIAVCLCVAVFATINVINPRPVPLDRLVRQVMDWVDDFRQSPWNTDLDAAPKQNYPIPSSILISNPRQWQQVTATPYDRKAIVYDLRADDGRGFASLIVVRTDNRTKFDAGRYFPSKPDRDTANLCIGFCWRDDENLLFILVVEGNERRYQRFVKSPDVIALRALTISRRT